MECCGFVDSSGPDMAASIRVLCSGSFYQCSCGHRHGTSWRQLPYRIPGPLPLRHGNVRLYVFRLHQSRRRCYLVRHTVVLWRKPDVDLFEMHLRL